MDFSLQFEKLFDIPKSNLEDEIGLTKELQDTRQALQESLSENDQLAELLAQLYKEARIENVATDTLIDEIEKPLFRNVPLPRNADNLPISEQAGYMVMYMKFLGYAARKSLEQYHVLKDDYDSMSKSIKTNAMPVEVKRTGALKVPELDGVREAKSNRRSESLVTPPATPPRDEEPKSEKIVKSNKSTKHQKQSKDI